MTILHKASRKYVAWIITPSSYNHLMRMILISCLLLLAACAPAASGATPVANDLRSYQTVTPSATASTPEGLVVSFETPVPSPTPFAYTVKSGDTLSQIAERFNVPLDALMAANPDVDPNAMSVGKTLKIPSSPGNPTGESTPTPMPFPVQQIECYPTSDRGLWCFMLAYNDSNDLIENVTAQITLVDQSGQTVASQVALLPLNILSPHTSLPLSVFFAPNIPSDAKPQARVLTAIRLLPGDGRYLPAVLHNTLAQVDWSGLSAQVSGQVILPADTKPAGFVWVAAVAYDEAGRVVGVRRWESKAGFQPGGTLSFSFMISSLAGRIERVDFAVEARP
jgi:LysM repeat protein